MKNYLWAHPNSNLAYMYLGGLLQQTGDLDGSLSAYREASRIADHTSTFAVSARLQVGRVLQQQGDPVSAVVEFRSVLLHPSDAAEGLFPLVYLYLGSALHQSGDPAAARMAWKQAIRWDDTKIIAKEARDLLRASS